MPILRLAALTSLLVALACALAGSAVAAAPIVADSGFRPQTDGYSFANYGAEEGYRNLTTTEMRRLFGDAVCVPGTRGDACRLTPVALKWMEATNKAMADGHCMGFAVTSELFHRRVGDPFRPIVFGAPTVPELSIGGNEQLQSHIAWGWAFQMLPALEAQAVSGTPSHILSTLRDALRDPRGEIYTLTIFQRDGSGGHAITPFAIEDHGAGRYAILVYDNNWPGRTRRVHVDTRRQTWRYQASINPNEREALYEGDAGTRSLGLIPSRAGLRPQDCFFCGDTNPGRSPIQLLWAGDPDNGEHSDLVISDRRGRRTGCTTINGRYRCFNHIPGVDVDSLFTAVPVWERNSNPSYTLPARRELTIALTGRNLRRPAREGVALIAGGHAFEVDDIRLLRGETDRIRLHADGRGITFDNDRHQTETPEVAMAIEGRGGDSYMFTIRAHGVRRGAEVGFRIDERRGLVVIDGRDAGGRGRYTLTMVRENARGRTVRSARVDLRSGARAIIDYRTWRRAAAPHITVR